MLIPNLPTAETFLEAKGKVVSESRNLVAYLRSIQ